MSHTLFLPYPSLLPSPLSLATPFSSPHCLLLLLLLFLIVLLLIIPFIHFSDGSLSQFNSFFSSVSSHNTHSRVWNRYQVRLPLVCLNHRRERERGHISGISVWVSQCVFSDLSYQMNNQNDERRRRDNNCYRTTVVTVDALAIIGVSKDRWSQWFSIQLHRSKGSESEEWNEGTLWIPWTNFQFEEKRIWIHMLVVDIW